MQEIQPFQLERYFAKFEFTAPYLLSASDSESVTLKELLALADTQSLAHWEQLSLGYTDSAGHPQLREEISSLYQHVLPSQVLVLTPEEGIYIAMTTLLSPGDEVIVLTPGYQSLSEIAVSIGCKVIPWPLSISGDRWALNLDGLVPLLSPRTKLIVINFPHNPTGFLPEIKDYLEIISVARANGIWLFSDEMYRLLEHSPDHRLPSMSDIYDYGISLSGMSKAFGMPGVRIGWLATQNNEAMRKFINFKDYTTICASAPSEILALIGLKARDFLIQRNIGIILSNLGYARSFLVGYPQLFQWFKPEGGSTVFPRWIGKTDINIMCEELVNQFGVMVVPGYFFGHTGSHFRVGLGRRNLPEVLGMVEKYLSLR